MESRILCFAALSVLIIVFSSGCTTFTGGTGSTGGQGIVIENFETDFKDVYAGGDFKLQAKFKNVGAVDSGEVLMDLYNLDASGIGGSTSITCITNECNTEKMLAKDTDRNTEGETKTCIWNCNAPSNVPRGTRVAFNPSVRLEYVYNTYTIKSINILSRDELRTVQNKGTALPSESVYTTEGSPVKIDVVVNGPISYDEGESRVEFPININLQNTGGGTPFYDDYDIKEDWDIVLLEFEGDSSMALFDCDLANTGSMTAYLWKGQSRSVTCNLKITLGDTIGFTQKNMKFTATYGYFIDATTSIEVIGK